MPEHAKPLIPSFTYHPSSSPFTVSSRKYLASQVDAEYEYLATGALVFDDSDSSTPRILLLQRSASDSMPGRWEIPGGGVDDDDESILHAVARELWEEAALTTVKVGPLVGEPHFFESRSGKQICRLNFLVEAKETNGALKVKLDPEEHQNFLWATEEDVRAKKAGGFVLDFTTTNTEANVLEAFLTKRQGR